MEAYSIAKAYQLDYNASIALMNIGEVFIELKKYPMAIKYYNQALDLNIRRNDNHHITTCYLALGTIHTQTGELTLAQKELSAAEKLAKTIGSLELLTTIYKSSSELFEAKRDHIRSLSYFKAYHSLNDSLFNTENIRQIAELQSRFDLENKEEEIAVLSKGKEQTQALMFKEKILRNYLTISALLLLFIAIILGRNIVLSSRVNKILVEKNAEIESHQKQIEQQNQTLSDFNKELMKENISAKYEILKAKINPHFLFNSLSTLSNLIVKDQHEASDFVRRFSKLYRRILELGNIQLITIEEELDFVSEFLYLQKIRFKDNLLYSFNVHKIHQRDFIPPFSIQLLVENAIKHNTISNENKLIIKVFSENECIIVSNNLQKKEFPEDSTKVGQKNIFDRYKFISRKAPEFTEEESRYIVSLPIIKDALL